MLNIFTTRHVLQFAFESIATVNYLVPGDN